jgi:hypothetical protein
MLKITPCSFLIRTIIAIMLTVGLVEFAARTLWAQKTFTYRSVGNFDYQFEIKWFRLPEYVKQNGGVDVIILGSSLVNNGIDPDVMAQEYYEQTGISLRIFNFGLEGLSINPNSVMAKILVDQYHPALLIYVTEMRDYNAGVGLEKEQSFMADPWIQYKQGKINPTGWLIDHSLALQYFLPYKNWTRVDFPQTIHLFRYRSLKTSASGYEVENVIASNIDIPPDPNNPDEKINFETFGNYKIAPSRLQNLESILSLGKKGDTKVLIVEMPVHPTFYVYVGGEAVHKQFQQALSSFVLKEGAYFIPAESCSDIPLAGRANRWHLNKLGAPIFSTCLGKQIAILANEQNMDFINSNAMNSPAK